MQKKRQKNILEAHSTLFTTMLEKLNLLTENRNIPLPQTATKGDFPSTPDFRTPPALSKSQQKPQSMDLDNELKRKAPTSPTSPPSTQPPEDESPQADQVANAARPSHNPSIRDQCGNGNNPPPSNTGGGMA